VLPFQVVPDTHEAVAPSEDLCVAPSKIVNVCDPKVRVRLVPALEASVENSVPFCLILLVERPEVLHDTELVQELAPEAIVQSGAVIIAYLTSDTFIPRHEP